MDSSLFAKLSPELRNRIYEYTLTGFNCFVLRRTRNDGSERMEQYPPARQAWPTGLSLTCKTIYKESIKLFYAENAFLLRNEELTKRLARQILPEFLDRLGSDLAGLTSQIHAAGTVASPELVWGNAKQYRDYWCPPEATPRSRAEHLGRLIVDCAPESLSWELRVHTCNYLFEHGHTSKLVAKQIHFATDSGIRPCIENYGNAYPLAFACACKDTFEEVIRLFCACFRPGAAPRELDYADLVDLFCSTVGTANGAAVRDFTLDIGEFILTNWVGPQPEGNSCVAFLTAVSKIQALQLAHPQRQISLQAAFCGTMYTFCDEWIFDARDLGGSLEAYIDVLERRLEAMGDRPGMLSMLLNTMKELRMPFRELQSPQGARFESSPFGRLSPELRERIYAFALVSPEPFEIQYCDTPRIPQLSWASRQQHPMALALACRAVYNESAKVVYGRNEYVVHAGATDHSYEGHTHVHNAPAGFVHMIGPANASALRSLTIDRGTLHAEAPCCSWSIFPAAVKEALEWTQPRCANVGIRFKVTFGGERGTAPRLSYDFVLDDLRRLEESWETAMDTLGARANGADLNPETYDFLGDLHRWLRGQAIASSGTSI